MLGGGGWARLHVGQTWLPSHVAGYLEDMARCTPGPGTVDSKPEWPTAVLYTCVGVKGSPPPLSPRGYNSEQMARDSHPS